jgi:glyoxylase-like metal-dependent hydrolase (beta-lactamase superfamily II)
MAANVTTFFDAATNTATHIVADPGSKKCAVVDSVLDFDAASGRTSTTSADAIIDYIEAEGLSLLWILETHVHADHLTAAPYIKDRLGGKTGIGVGVKDVQSVFGDVFGLQDFPTDGRQFDQLFSDGDTFEIGELSGFVIETPGHTPACCTFVVDDAGFVGDTLFMPDSGTARCDFPGGDAATLYESIQKILALPAKTRLYICHDYKGKDRDDFAWETTVAEQKEKNIHVHDGLSKEDFVKFRSERDATLSMPKLILPSLQVNIRAGHLPAPDDNGVSYLKIPLNAL